MIRTLFLGRLDHERLKKNGINPKVIEAVAAVSRVLAFQSERGKELSESFLRAGFRADTAQKTVFDGRIRAPPIGLTTSRRPGERNCSAPD